MTLIILFLVLSSNANLVLSVLIRLQIEMKFRSNQFNTTHYNLELQEIYLKQFLSAAVQQSQEEPATPQSDNATRSKLQQQQQQQQQSTSSKTSASKPSVKSTAVGGAAAIEPPTSSTRPSVVVNTNTMRNKSTSSSATSSNLNSVSGLNNLGNSCFFNAVLQVSLKVCLVSCPPTCS